MNPDKKRSITECLQNLHQAGKKALIPYITAGDPHPQHTVALMHTLVDAGADIIELGIPFSDPMADGPVIQKACERALAHHTSLKMVLAMVAEFRIKDQATPVVLMGYMNPIEAMGHAVFAKAAKDAGVDAVLTVDMPPEEARELAGILKQHALDVIFLLAPTTSDSRIQAVSELGSGYVYYVSLKGVTGSAQLNVAEVADKVAHIRSLLTIPVGVGFGIRDATSAQQIARVSDGVIVGSVLVDAIATHAPDLAAIQAALHALLKPMRQALDAV